MIDPGLCAGCRHARQTGNRRGSLFWMCTAHRFDPEMPKYPALPVRDCRHLAPPESKGPPGQKTPGQVE
jgi:hypothetical protein